MKWEMYNFLFRLLRLADEFLTNLIVRDIQRTFGLNEELTKEKVK